MKKKIKGQKFSRGQGARRALFRSLMSSLVSHGAIVTTKAKAKAISAKADKLVNLAKDDSVAGRRRLYKILGNDRETQEALLKVITPLFSDRKGGYTRIINLPARRGDFAQMARIEWVKEVVQVQEQVKGKSVARKSKAKDDRSSKAVSKKRGLLKKVKKAK